MEHLQGWAEQGGEGEGLGRGKPEMCRHLQGAGSTPAEAAPSFPTQDTDLAGAVWHSDVLSD